MSKTLRRLIAATLLISVGYGAIDRIWPAAEFGTVGDGATLNTAFIQKAIDTCQAAGGGTVVVANGRFVTGTLLLKDNVTLHIAKDTVLLGSARPEDYRSIDPFTDATGQQRGACLIGALKARNIAITGEGTIDGNGAAFLPENLAQRSPKMGTKGRGANRPFLIRFVQSTQIRVEKIHLRQPAAWTCHLFQCDSITVDGVTIFSHANRNNDGIDLDSSSHAAIKNCDIDTGDDAICFKTTSPQPTHDIQVSDCRLKSEWGAIKFGTESMGDFFNIAVKDCTLHDTHGGGIKILSADGANIRDVTIGNITMENTDMPIFIRLGERLLTYRGAPRQAVGSIDRITISSVTATARSSAQSRVAPPAGIFITGTPGHAIGRVTLNNIRIRLPGGGTAVQSAAVVEEQESKYPEFSFFGVLPAFGLFARHVDHLDIANLAMNTLSPDHRHPARLEDINHLTWSQVQANGQDLPTPADKLTR